MTPFGLPYNAVQVPAKSWKVKIALSDKAWEYEVLICGCRGVEKGSERHAVLLKTFGKKYSEKEVLTADAKYLRAMAEHDAAKQLFVQSQTYEGITFEYLLDDDAASKKPFGVSGGWLIASQYIAPHKKLVATALSAPSGGAKPFLEPSYVYAPHVPKVSPLEPLPFPTTKLLDLEYKLQPPDYEKILGASDETHAGTHLEALKKIATSMGVPEHLLGAGGSVSAQEAAAKLAEADAVFGGKPLTTADILAVAKKVEAQKNKVASFGMLYGQPGIKFVSNVHDSYVFEGPVDVLKIPPHEILDYTDPLKLPSPVDQPKLAELYDSLKKLAGSLGLDQPKQAELDASLKKLGGTLGAAVTVNTQKPKHGKTAVMKEMIKDWPDTLVIDSLVALPKALDHIELKFEVPKNKKPSRKKG